MKTMEADVIVVAAGPAGLAAAITAGENDLKGIVFEKSNTTGGAAKDRKSTRLNSSHRCTSRMPSSA